jgi:hypothetical protein
MNNTYTTQVNPSSAAPSKPHTNTNENVASITHDPLPFLFLFSLPLPLPPPPPPSISLTKKVYTGSSYALPITKKNNKAPETHNKNFVRFPKKRKNNVNQKPVGDRVFWRKEKKKLPASGKSEKGVLVGFFESRDRSIIL